nr:MAG TPA: hypothetical protein [Caudoviricetes sp.]
MMCFADSRNHSIYLLFGMMQYLVKYGDLV